MDKQKTLYAFFDVKNAKFNLRMVSDNTELLNTQDYNCTLYGIPYTLTKRRHFNSNSKLGYTEEWDSYDTDYIQIEWCEKSFDNQSNFRYRKVDRLWYNTWDDPEIDFEDYIYNNSCEESRRLKNIYVMHDNFRESRYCENYESYYTFKKKITFEYIVKTMV